MPIVNCEPCSIRSETRGTVTLYKASNWMMPSWVTSLKFPSATVHRPQLSKFKMFLFSDSMTRANRNWHQLNVCYLAIATVVLKLIIMWLSVKIWNNPANKNASLLALYLKIYCIMHIPTVIERLSFLV